MYSPLFRYFKQASLQETIRGMTEINYSGGLTLRTLNLGRANPAFICRRIQPIAGA